MKIDTYFVNAVIVLLVVVPYVLFIIMANQKTSSLKKQFKHLVRVNNLNLDWENRWNKNIVGIDFKTKQMLIVQQNDTEVVHRINLRGIAKSNICCNSKFINNRGQKKEVLKEIILRLESYNDEITDIVLFDDNLSYTYDHELSNANKLNRVIHSLLIFKPIITSAA
ncbi:hypothetical protein [Christiangramia aquimixticola]|uniref:hypothetical protein n=1 Tax=Christiangramia aquimixticola TaxID=1697558 RepID=UPI003AA837A0